MERFFDYVFFNRQVAWRYPVLLILVVAQPAVEPAAEQAVVSAEVVTTQV